MSFTRVPYDSCAYKEKLNQTQKPMYYKLSRWQADHCEPCLSSDGPRNFRLANNSETTTVIKKDQIDKTMLTEVESLLSNRGYPNSKCLSPHMLQEKRAKLDAFPKDPHYKECSPKLRPEVTRITHPLDNYKEMYIDRYEWPIINPSEWVWWFREPKNTQLAVRDNHQTRYIVPLPDMTQPVEVKR